MELLYFYISYVGTKKKVTRAGAISESTDKLPKTLFRSELLNKFRQYGSSVIPDFSFRS